MRVTSIGHAGLHIATDHGTILCDPWFTPAYFASWYPFPANDGLDMELLGAADYLYVSHLHLDHYDPEWLKRWMNKDTTVLLPDYGVPDLRVALESLGFHRFITTTSAEPFEHDGLTLMIVSMTAPNDGPLGDSCLSVDDGTAAFLNQNDCRPTDLEPIVQFGSYDGHSLQYSGAIWFPMVYDLPARVKEGLGERKRVNGLDRARRFAEAVGARWILPNSGPPAFLDDDLFEINDFGQKGNVFPDQTTFLDYLGSMGMTNALLVSTGSTVELDRHSAKAVVTHPGSDEHVMRPFTDKRRYLAEYAARTQHDRDERKLRWSHTDQPLLPQLKQWWEPLMQQMPTLCGRLGDRILLQTEHEGIIVDFIDQVVESYAGQEYRYRLVVEDRLVRSCVERRLADWVNELFLSCRFAASRKGPYNEHVYTWFKSLSPEHAEYVETWLSSDRESHEMWRFGDHLVQRHCPHLGADLARFGDVDDEGVLTCQLHGWQFDIDSGKCLTSDDATLRSKRITHRDPEDSRSQATGH
ncbi:MAG TPA: Rieske 2Fe-2S domain-containing protein [Actinomycetes bacterium]|nr:Rieske 2Fe-2S domain-containing protein [Actinomycetes bacterium]